MLIKTTTFITKYSVFSVQYGLGKSPPWGKTQKLNVYYCLYEIELQRRRIQSTNFLYLSPLGNCQFPVAEANFVAAVNKLFSSVPTHISSSKQQMH